MAQNHEDPNLDPQGPKQRRCIDSNGEINNTSPMGITRAGGRGGKGGLRKSDLKSVP
jgi:hypothetical protein